MLFWVSPIYFAIFVLSTQFVLVNVVVAVLMKQLEDSKDSNDDSISDMDESFSNEHKNSESDDDYDASVDYATEVRDVCLNIGEEVDNNSNNEPEKIFKERHLGCEITVTDETDMREIRKDALQLHDAHGSMDKGSLHGEYGLENAIIVVSPARGHGYENSYIPYLSNEEEEEEYYEMKASSLLGLKRNGDLPEISCCRSMPELSTSIRTDNQRSLSKTKESRSCPQTMSCNEEKTSKSKCKRRALDRPFLARKRSRSKVAPLTRGLTVPSQTLSVYDDVISTSISSNIDS